MRDVETVCSNSSNKRDAAPRERRDRSAAFRLQGPPMHAKGMGFLPRATKLEGFCSLNAALCRPERSIIGQELFNRKERKEPSPAEPEPKGPTTDGR